MKRRIKYLCILLSICLMGCGQKGSNISDQYESDSLYVKEKGTLIVGVTEFEPLDYIKDGEWVGFDAEMAALFAESLGVSIEFSKIEWDKKTKLLNQGQIDCIWNGMTLTEEVQKEMSCSVPYLNNAQLIVIPEKKADRLQKEEDCIHLLFAVEQGSAGEEELKNRNYRYTAVDTQMDALQSVLSGKTDVAIIDAVMAGALIGQGKQFSELMDIVAVSDEEYGVGFRNNSDLVEEFNIFWEENLKNGTVAAVAEKYGVQSAIIE